MIKITESATKQLKTIITEENDPELKLRVSVEGGGCSGFQYAFSFDKEQSDDDFVLEQDQVSVLVDPFSLQYMDGATIDYKSSLTQSSFVIENPQARATCGCGSSFTPF
jgi:iron-sulfur cluster insertion protein